MLQHRIKSAPLPWQSSDIKSWWWLNICTYEIYIHICCINYTCWQVAGRSDTGMDWVLKSKHIPQALSCWISSQGAAGSHVWHVNIIVGIPTNGDCFVGNPSPRSKKISIYINQEINWFWISWTSELASWSRLQLHLSFVCLTYFSSHVSPSHVSPSFLSWPQHPPNPCPSFRTSWHSWRLQLPSAKLCTMFICWGTHRVLASTAQADEHLGSSGHRVSTCMCSNIQKIYIRFVYI